MEHTGRRNKKIHKLKPRRKKLCQPSRRAAARGTTLMNAMTDLETIQQQEKLGYLGKQWQTI